MTTETTSAPIVVDAPVIDPAAAAAPVVPTAPVVETIGDAPVIAPAPEADAEGTAFRYHETGDVGLDVALDFIGRMGFGPEDPAVIAATAGKFELLEAKLSIVGDKAAGWERFIALAKNSYTSATAAGEAKTAAITTSVTNAAAKAGVDWAAVKQWASVNADPAEKAAINTMLTADPVQARAAANLLIQAYGQSAGAEVNPQSAVNPAANTAPLATNAPLSPREYSAAVNALAGKIGGGALDASPEYAALKQRRMAHRG